MDNLNKQDKAASYLIGRFGKTASDLCPPVSSSTLPDLSIEYKSEQSPEDRFLPQVTCVCPTYGRFKWVKNAVACFLLQDYPNKKLLICNDHKVRINEAFLPDNIRVINYPKRFPTLGDKRQFMLEQVDTPLVSHWDDDDIYMPWFLLWSIRQLTDMQRLGIKMIRLHPAIFVEINDDKVDILGQCDWEHEAMDVFYKDKALQLGGYGKINLGEAVVLQSSFVRSNLFARVLVETPMFAYLYNRYNSALHLCQNQDGDAAAYKRCAVLNNDTGNFDSIIDDPKNPLNWAKTRMFRIISSYAESGGKRFGENFLRSLTSLFRLSLPN